MIKLGSKGDPMSELEIQRRLKWFRERSERGNLGTVFLPDWMVKEDPVLQRAVEVFDWLKIQGEPE